MTVRKMVVGVSLLGFAVLFSGCSTLYHQKWKRVPVEFESANGLTGRWEGTWVSDVNQHQGRLRCIVSDDSKGEYDLHFWATWSLFSGSYHLTAPVTQTNNVYRFRGSKNLGALAGGEYRFEGVIDGQEFQAAYTSAKDHGRFLLQRVPAD